MRIISKKSLLAFAAVASLMACNSPQPPKANSQQQEQTTNANSGDLDINKISEALGHFIGRNLNAPGIQFNLEGLVKGIREGAAGKPSPMSDEEYREAMALLQERSFNTMAEKNLESANAFMKENASAHGVVELVPGKLQYMILEEGKEPAVVEHGTPQINYTGKYQDGTVFGSSESAGGPITIPLDQTVQGFSQGITGMKEGEKRRLFVHPDAGYGLSGQLQPNALLIFDIEVVKATSPEKDNVDDSTLGESDSSEYDEDVENEHEAR